MDHCEKLKRQTNPRESANIFSLITFGYTIGLFKKGFKEDLEEEDLYEVVGSCRSTKCGDRCEKQWRRTPSIFKLLWRRFGKQYAMICVADIFWTQTYSVLQPHGLSRLISYFQENQTKITKMDAYYCAGIVVFLKLFQILFWQNVRVFEIIVGTKIQTSLKSLLYRKALRLSAPALAETNLGNVVTILTKDIFSIEHNLWLIMDFITFTIQSVTVSYLLWRKMGASAFIALAVMFGALPIQVYLSSLITKMRLKVGQNSDDRLHVTQETLSAIKIIKMYTWERFFIRKIAQSRKKEVINMMRIFYINYVLVAIGIITSKITFLILILSYIWLGNTTNTEIIFYVLSLFHQLTTALSIMLPMNMGRVAQFRASFIRLNKVLQSEELNKIDNICKGDASVHVKSISFSMKDKDILKNVSLTIKEPGLTMITGVVGSGKTSLLKIILQDYEVSEGHLETYGSISYASQEPWLFPSSIKQNILFGEHFNKSRYHEVLRVCALEYDLNLLENGDETIVADGGQNLSKGQQSRINLARAIYRNSDIYLLDDSLTALDGHVQDYIFKECIKKFLKNKVCILVSQNARQIEKADYVIVIEQGSISFAGKPEEISKQKLNGITAVKNIETQSKDKDIRKYSIIESEQQYSKKKVYREIKKAGTVDLDVYKKYIQYGGGFFVLFLIVFLYVLAQIFESVADKMLTKWIDVQQKVLDMEGNLTINATYHDAMVSKRDDLLMLYTILVVLKSVMGLVKFYALLRFCRAASLNLHKAMSSHVVNAVMTFFDTNFIGNILNRFSYDLNNIDEHLPFAFPVLMSVMFSCIGSVILVATVNWPFLIPSFIFISIVVAMRMIYIPTGRSLKRLEAATRSPLVGHINSSLDGLTTIRAFKAEGILKDEFDRHQDLYTSAIFTLKVSMTSFGFFMDLVSAVYMILIIVRFLFFEHDITAGNVGLALTQVFMLSDFVQWGIKEWVNLENHMTSVERALEYAEVEEESKDGNKLKDWPRQGSLTYEKVTLRYESSKEPVLKAVSFSIRPNQKIGIVGRTGAGKSSIISTLFRLYDNEGKIEIDGMDIKSLSLSFLRENIAIIPQDPILFSGTLRENIDPYRKHSDHNIWQAIEKVKIKELVPSLDIPIDDNGSNFSAGQKQLICLARAAIAKYKIVVLDEATANMDSVTDKMLHSVIEEIFADCTILTVAHRLHSVIDCDMVIVMDKGELVEFDNPKKLLQDKSSMFYKMCQESKMD